MAEWNWINRIDQKPENTKPSSAVEQRKTLRMDVWSDYVCPFCYLEEPVLERISQEYQDRVTIHWRAFELRPEPVPTLDPDGEYLHAIWNRAVYPMAHLRRMKLRLPPSQPRSRRAFEAAEFARKEGCGEEMHRALFQAFFQEGRDLSSLAVLLQIGLSLGLDQSRLRAALESGRYSRKVLEDEQRAIQLGILGVPTMILSRPGEPIPALSSISGAQPYELVRATLERLLAGD